MVSLKYLNLFSVIGLKSYLSVMFFLLTEITWPGHQLSTKNIAVHCPSSKVFLEDVESRWSDVGAFFDDILGNNITSCIFWGLEKGEFSENSIELQVIGWMKCNDFVLGTDLHRLNCSNNIFVFFSIVSLLMKTI